MEILTDKGPVSPDELFRDGELCFLGQSNVWSWVSIELKQGLKLTVYIEPNRYLLFFEDDEVKEYRASYSLQNHRRIALAVRFFCEKAARPSQLRWRTVDQSWTPAALPKKSRTRERRQGGRFWKYIAYSTGAAVIAAIVTLGGASLFMIRVASPAPVLEAYSFPSLAEARELILSEERLLINLLRPEFPVSISDTELLHADETGLAKILHEEPLETLLDLPAAAPAKARLAAQILRQQNLESRIPQLRDEIHELQNQYNRARTAYEARDSTHGAEPGPFSTPAKDIARATGMSRSDALRMKYSRQFDDRLGELGKQLVAAREALAMKEKNLEESEAELAKARSRENFFLSEIRREAEVNLISQLAVIQSGFILDGARTFGQPASTILNHSFIPRGKIAVVYSQRDGNSTVTFWDGAMHTTQSSFFSNNFGVK